MAELAELLRRIRAGQTPALKPAEVELLVAWLLEKREFREAAAGPREDPALRALVFQCLDAALFSHGELRLAAAGLGSDEDHALRKTRFRRLAAAFHPDRHPEMGEWLTARSQSVLRAYGRFRKAPAQTASRATAASQMAPEPRPGRHAPGPRDGWIRTGLLSLRRRFGADPRLAHKLIAALALVAMLPVLNLILAPAPKPTTQAPGAAAGADAPMSRTTANLDPAHPDAKPETAAPTPKDARGGAGEATGLRDAARLALSPQSYEPVELPRLDEELAGLGLKSDRERLYERLRRADAPAGQRISERQRTGLTDVDPPAATGVSAAARTRDMTDDAADAGHSPGPAPSAASSANAGAAGSPERALTIHDPAHEPPGDTESDTTASLVSASTAKSANPASTPGPSDHTGTHDRTPQPTTTPLADRTTKPRTSGSAAPPAPESTPLPPPEVTLALGLLAKRPAGETLAAFADHLAHGRLVPLMARFNARARVGEISGLDRIADHYRQIIDRSPQRDVTLKVVRIEHDRDRMRIEADLQVIGRSAAGTEVLESGRRVIELAGDPPRIRRIEP